MDNSLSSNKRILKNTLFLYFRMMLLMVISFYSSRVVLEILGVEDYGIYNVVGGIVAMISFVNSSMSLASNRFFSFAIGKNDIELLNKTYSTSVILHFIFGIIIIILSETIGLYYFYNYLNIPKSSIDEAMWVYQLSIISMFVSINNVPIMALIISHEDMDAYAYVSLLEGVLKLAVSFLLFIKSFGNLKTYAIMMFMTSLIILLTWRIYAKYKYKNCSFSGQLDKVVFKDMTGFIGWQVFGSLSWVLRNQGVNLVLNFFFGPILNTARSLALQVNSGLTSLVSNFQMASNPQIVKNVANDNSSASELLLYRTSKLSFLLLLIIAFPVFIEADKILYLWLGQIPPYTLSFVRLIIVASLIESMSGTLQHTILATGRIKKYTKIVTSIMLSDIVFVYIAFKIGLPPESMIYIEMIIFFMAFIARLFIAKERLDISMIEFFKYVTLREIAVLLAAFGICMLNMLFDNSEANLIVCLMFQFLLILIICYSIGLTKAERHWIVSLIQSKIKNQ